MTTQEPTVKLPEMSLAEFLESAPPGTKATIPDLYIIESRILGPGQYWAVNTPTIRLYCSSEGCGGPRSFTGEKNVLSSSDQVFLTYTCRNCNQSTKLFAVTTAHEDPSSAQGTALKLGEDPPFGPPMPGRVISLIGPDRETLLKGRRAENLGLGIGAFAYYRRVVENQKGRLIEKIAEVAARLGADKATLEAFNKAKNETQFSRAIDDVKKAFPETLMIHGQNPLTLLHSALSEGLHAQTDEDCLELATSIRVVLSELAERISQALKDEAELKSAVSRLLKPKP
ncbi:MAG TPA: hypothetical protein VD835_19260 [Pyrinomonadaceae bacterium]|nr:hypothetical protein [Pyrinomonadaceae bacterium]